MTAAISEANASARSPNRSRVEAAPDLSRGLAELWSTDGPHLLEVAIDVRANAFPKIAFGHPISEMEPFAAPKALEAT